MSKNKQQEASRAELPEKQETVIDPPAMPSPKETGEQHASQYIEIELRYGQCIIAPASNQDEEILTTIDDWNSLYNAGKNQGRFILKAEKKSS